MILPTGHWQEVSVPRRVSRRERWMIGGVLAVVAIVVIAVAIAFTSHRRTSRHGCIDVSAATAIGGSELYRCGAAARELCTGASGPSSQNAAFRRALAEACRRAGLPAPATGH